jgi:hypothetical protein
MRNRRLLWCLAAGAFLLAAGAVLWVVVRVLPDRITPENYDRIAEGMTQGEVEAILGRPADLDNLWAAKPLPKSSIWAGEQWTIMVEFDASGRVLARACEEGGEGELRELFGLPELTFWQKLRRSLGW